jgi:hypothetical protein
MKKNLRFASIVAVVISALFLILYFNNNIGIYKSNIEKDARISQKIDDSWKVEKSTTDAMSAMLFYNENLSDYIFSIYVNRDGLSFGYFFRGGGSIVAENEGIAEYKIEGYYEKAYLSMNRQQVSKIEIDNGNTIKIINIDYTKPFAIILPDGKGTIKFHNKDGDIVQTISHTL